MPRKITMSTFGFPQDASAASSNSGSSPSGSSPSGSLTPQGGMPGPNRSQSPPLSARPKAHPHQRRPPKLGMPQLILSNSLILAGTQKKLMCFTDPGSLPASFDSVEVNLFLSQRFHEATSGGSTSESLKAFLIEMSGFFREIERLGRCKLDEQKFNSRKHVIALAVDNANGKPLDLLNQYRDHSYFRDQTRVVVDVARERMVSNIKSHFEAPKAGWADTSSRIRQRDRHRVSQGEYVLHVTHLFNLENRMSRVDVDNLIDAMAPADHAHFRSLLGKGHLLGVRFKDAIPLLLQSFPIKKGTRDSLTRSTHPASLLLQICTGLVFHAGHGNQTLVDPKSAYSFDKFSQTMAYKYLEAEQNCCVVDFFEKAFVKEEPCFEGVIENMLNYAPPSHGATTIFHPRPTWDDHLSSNENVEGFLAWVEREMLVDFAEVNSIDLSTLSLQDVSELESSYAYASYLIKNEDLINARMQQLTHNRVAQSELAALIHEDLMRGVP